MDCITSSLDWNAGCKILRREEVNMELSWSSDFSFGIEVLLLHCDLTWGSEGKLGQVLMKEALERIFN